MPSFDWPEYHLSRGEIRDPQGFRLIRSPWNDAIAPLFRDIGEAEAWLTAHNVRGTVRERRAP